MVKVSNSSRVRISPKDTKIICSPILLFFLVGVVLMGVVDDRGVLWVRFTVNWDWVLVSRKSVRKVAIQNVDRDSPGPPSSSNHGASRDKQTPRYSIRAEQKNLYQDS
jgi:hypothetical protein